jgi:predicted helicase
MKFEDLFGRLASESHIKGKSFEKLSKWWLTNDEIWSSLVKKVWLWDEWPNRNTREPCMSGLILRERDSR